MKTDANEMVERPGGCYHDGDIIKGRTE